jgi:hypothetical protein
MKVPTKLQPFLKAIAPAALTVVAVIVDWISQGKFDKQTAAIAITGLVSAIVTYFVPNKQSTSSPMLEPEATPKPPVG